MAIITTTRERWHVSSSDIQRNLKAFILKLCIFIIALCQYMDDHLENPLSYSFYKIYGDNIRRFSLYILVIVYFTDFF